MNNESVHNIITETILIIGEGIILALTLKKVFDIVKFLGGF